MAINVNRVTLVGRLGADPEEPSNDRAPLSVSIATSESWKDKSSGEKKEKTEWHRVKIWPDHSKRFLLDYAHKGDLLYVEGQLETSSYEKDGVTMYSTSVVVKPFGGGVQLMNKEGGGKREPGEDRDEPSRSGGAGKWDEKNNGPGRARRPSANRPAFDSNGMDDDIPF